MKGLFEGRIFGGPSLSTEGKLEGRFNMALLVLFLGGGGGGLILGGAIKQKVLGVTGFGGGGGLYLEGLIFGILR